MSIQIQSINDLGEVKRLLQFCELPVDDLAQPPQPVFFGIYRANALAAVIGLEIYSSAALLRSLAVTPGSRGRGLGHALVAFAERYAAQKQVECLYLLTTGAADFFGKLGYALLDRSAAPPAIRSTAQFSGVCPTSAAFMCKPLA